MQMDLNCWPIDHPRQLRSCLCQPVDIDGSDPARRGPFGGRLWSAPDWPRPWPRPDLPTKTLDDVFVGHVEKIGQSTLALADMCVRICFWRCFGPYDDAVEQLLSLVPCGRLRRLWVRRRQPVAPKIRSSTSCARAAKLPALYIYFAEINIKFTRSC